MYFRKFKYWNNHKNKNVSHKRELYVKISLRSTGVREHPKGESTFSRTAPKIVSTDFETGCLGLGGLVLGCP